MLSVAPVWVGVSILAFTIANLAPGDPAAMILQRQTGEPPSAADVARLRSQMGLDRPVIARYGSWLSGSLRGDLGQSYRTGKSVFSSLTENIPSTLRLSGAALLVGFAIALPLGVASAVHQNSLLDHIVRIVALGGVSLPSFVIGYILVLLFSVKLGWFPVAGSGDLSHFVLPVMTLGLMEASALTRLTRASMLGVLFDDYVRSARAKGASELRVVVRHALRNALNPLVTFAGIRFGKLMGGAVIIEMLFARPGLGTEVVGAIFDRDYPTIQGFVLLAGTLFLAVNLIVDITYARLDPRQRERLADSNATD